MPLLSPKPIACFIAAASLLVTPSFAIEIPLSSQAVREAYFLGQRNNDSTQDFLEKYRQHLPTPDSGPWISTVELLTPYAETVELSRQRSFGYSAQDAAQDYKKRGDTLRVTIIIEFTPSYGPMTESAPDNSHATNGYTPRPPDFWKDFSFRLFDGDTELTPLEKHGQPNYAPGGIGTGASTMTGATIVLTFDPAKIAALSDVAVVVDTPDGQQVVAPYDLTSLR